MPGIKENIFIGVNKVNYCFYFGFNCKWLCIIFQRRMKDTAQATSAFVLAPFTFGLSLGILGALEGGDGPEAVEYSRLKGEYQAVYETSKKKKCRIDRYR